MNKVPPAQVGVGGEDEDFTARRLEAKARAPTVNLTSVSVDLPVKDRIALADAKIRRDMAYSIMAVFVVVNILTLFFVDQLFRTDQSDLLGKIIAPPDRVVTPHVLITLLGATTVQLGTITVIMARFIFRAPVDRAHIQAQ